MALHENRLLKNSEFQYKVLLDTNSRVKVLKVEEVVLLCSFYCHSEAAIRYYLMVYY